MSKIVPGSTYEANAARFRADLTDKRHGTYNGYANLGCRCRPCIDASAAWKRARRHAMIPTHVHGTENGYRNYGCRCPECKVAAAKHDAARRRHDTAMRRAWREADREQARQNLGPPPRLGGPAYHVDGPRYLGTVVAFDMRTDRFFIQRDGGVKLLIDAEKVTGP